MSLRTKVFSIISVLTAAAIIVVFVVSDTILLRNYDDMDRNHMSQHLDLVNVAIDDEVANLNTVNLDWSSWDDSYDFVQDRNSGYAESNLVPSIFENLGLDMIVYVDDAGNVAWEGMSASDGFADVSQQTLDALGLSGQTPNEADEPSKTGFVMIGDQPLMFVANPILTSEGLGPARGFLVWGRFIGESHGAKWSEKTLAAVNLYFPGDMTGDENTRQALIGLQDEERWIVPIDDHQIAAYQLVNDLSGRPSFLLQVTAPREFIIQGSSTVNSMTLALGLAIAGLGLGFFLILGHAVVTPLSSLSRAVARIGVKGNDKSRVSAEGGDEVALLGQAINDTLDRLDDSQKALRHAAEEWRITFDSINDPISIQDNDHRLLRVNKAFARAYGREPGELVGKKCYEVIHGTQTPPESCPHMETMINQKPLTREYYDQVRDTHLELSMAPIIGDDGRMTGVVQITKDVTERKRMEGRLIVTDRLASLGEMAAGIAHEINNPLTGVIGFTEMLLESDLPDSVKSDVRVIAEASARVAEIVKRMLTFARQTRPLRTSTDINELINSTLALQAYALKTSNIDIVRNLDSELPWLVVDPGQVQQVFLNLVINAQYAMKKAHGRGTLTITTSTDGDHVSITITDDGPGIPKDIIDKLFQPFFTTKEPGEGTGLGLALSRSIILEHGGRLNVCSEPGHGASFTIELPRSVPAESDRHPVTVSSGESV